MRIGRGILLGPLVALAAYLAWDRIEAHRLASDIREIAARGEPTDSSADAMRPATPEEREAAELYVEAAERAREMAQQDGRLTRIDVDAVVGRIDIRDLESTFRRDAPALQLLDRATPLPFAGFGELDDDGSSQMGLETLAGLAALRADLLAYRGDGDGAAASLVGAVRVQRTIPRLFARAFLITRQLGSLRVLLRHVAPSPASLDRLQTAFSELPDDDGVERDLMLQRARLIERRWPAMQIPRAAPPVAWLLHPFLIRPVRVQLEQFTPVLAAARTPWPDKLGVLSALAEEPSRRRAPPSWPRLLFGPPVNVAALMAMPAMAGTTLAGRRLAVAALAIERYRRANDGRPPADLAALVPRWLPAVPIDPFTGKPLVYRPAADRYLLYSVDVNRNDDGGLLYGPGSMNPMPLPRTRDLGLAVELTPRRGAE